MHDLLEPEMLAIECDRGIHVVHDIADLHGGIDKTLSLNTYFQYYSQASVLSEEEREQL